MRRRRGRRNFSTRRVDALLDQVKNGPGHQSGDRKRGDRRPREDRHGRSGRTAGPRSHRPSAPHGQGSKTLDVQRHRELFAGLVTVDFDFLMSQPFAAGPRVLSDLLPQSVVGRAQNGHGYFTDDFGTPLCFPDATFERVLSVLEGIDPNLKGDQVRQRRGQMLAEFGRWLLANVDQRELRLNPGGQPLFGIDFLADEVVQTREFLTGLVLAGFMDDWSYRANCMRHHRKTFDGMPFSIGGGDILIVDAANLEMVGLGETGARVFTDQELRTLQDVGVICRSRHHDYAFPEYDQAFFRRQMGDGVCDDLAMIYIGAKYGYSAMLGAFVMDAIDTYDKYLLNLTWGGFDTWLAGRVQKHFLETEDAPLVWDDAIFDLIHFAAKRNFPAINLSSSHRRLIQVEKGAGEATILNHWRFVSGDPVCDIKLGFARVPGREFYKVAHNRCWAVGLEVALPVFVSDRP